jgi:hypothetical protein
MKNPNKKTIRVVVHVDTSMADRILAKSVATGSTVGEVLRQAFRLSEFADTKGSKKKE